MISYLPSRLYKRLIFGGVSLVAIMLSGTIGYWFIGGKQYSFLDCFYMTFITVASIGYTEIVDLSHNPGGRIFTIFIATAGIGMMAYSLSLITAIIVEGDLKETYERKKMDKLISKLNEHFIVCGIGTVGQSIVSELHSTKRQNIIVDVDEKKLQHIAMMFEGQLYLQGDATDETTLIQAGIMNAKGLFAATDDDSRNLVISLTAKHLNSKVRVVVRANEPSHIEKMKKAGADAVTLPAYIGGFRMINEMVRATTVSFFETLLADKENNLRVEAIPLKRFAGKNLSSLNLQEYPNTMALAIQSKDGWTYKPQENYLIKENDFLMALTTPQERVKLEQIAEAISK